VLHERAALLLLVASRASCTTLQAYQLDTTVRAHAQQVHGMPAWLLFVTPWTWSQQVARACDASYSGVRFLLHRVRGCFLLLLLVMRVWLCCTCMPQCKQHSPCACSCAAGGSIAPHLVGGCLSGSGCGRLHAALMLLQCHRNDTTPVTTVAAAAAERARE
jgi:hypothetical protein